MAIGLTCEHLATSIVTDRPSPKLGWRFKSSGPKMQSAYRILVASTLANLFSDKADVWDSGRVDSGNSIDIHYHGRPLKSREHLFWKVKVWDDNGRDGKWSRPACFRMGLLDGSDWQAEWIGVDMEPYAQIRYAKVYAPFYLRKEFVVGEDLTQATLYASALGWYQFKINGRRVGVDYFTPGWTDYRIRIYYNTYDVTDLIRSGKNAIGATVAGGWYNWPDQGEKMRVIGQLELQFKDGSKNVITTNGDWRCSTGGERYSHILFGESCDMRKASPGWDMPGFDDSTWKAPDNGRYLGEAFASKFHAPATPAFEAYPSVPARVRAKHHPVFIKTIVANEIFVVDMGVYYAGFVRLKIKGAQRGQLIRIRYGDWINKDGTLYTANLRLAVHMADEYICSGDQEEIWAPRFTFRGHRYIEITGWPDPNGPTADDVTGVELTQAYPDSINFSCGSYLLNELFAALRNTCRACTIEAPLDCSQRDERQGWFGDALFFLSTANYFAKLQPFYRKWAISVLDSQHKAGGFPRLAPSNHRYYPDDFDGFPGWADLGVFLPWKIFWQYGDREILGCFYPAICRYVEFRSSTLHNWLQDESKSWFGDWNNINGCGADSALAYAAYTAKMFMTAAEIAVELKYDEDALRFKSYFVATATAFCDKYVCRTGMRHPTQGNCTLALAFNLVKGDIRDFVVKQLLDEFKGHNWGIGTGTVSTPEVLRTLCEVGYPDAAYSIVLKDTYPSWGYMIKSGDVSIWEHWCSRRPELLDDNFASPNMNSACHPALGAIGAWMVENIGGINALAPGFTSIRLNPLPDSRVGKADVSYLSPMGQIRSAWTLDGYKLHMETETPSNTKVEIWVPAKKKEDVSISGDGGKLIFLRMEDNFVVFYAQGGGKYVFDSATKGIPWSSPRNQESS